MNKNLELKNKTTATAEITEAEQCLYALRSHSEMLSCYREKLDPKKEVVPPAWLYDFESVIRGGITSEYTKEAANSLQAVENMLHLVIQYQATRMALCSVMDKAIAELAQLITVAEEQVEKKHLMQNISAEMTSWSLDQLRAFEALVQTLHLG